MTETEKNMSKKHYDYWCAIVMMVMLIANDIHGHIMVILYCADMIKKQKGSFFSHAWHITLIIL